MITDRVRKLSMAIMTGLLIVAAALGYWQVLGADDVLDRPTNPRTVEEERRIFDVARHRADDRCLLDPDVGVLGDLEGAGDELLGEVEAGAGGFGESKGAEDGATGGRQNLFTTDRLCSSDLLLEASGTWTLETDR